MVHLIYILYIVNICNAFISPFDTLKLFVLYFRYWITTFRLGFYWYNIFLEYIQISLLGNKAHLTCCDDTLYLVWYIFVYAYFHQRWFNNNALYESHYQDHIMFVILNLNYAKMVQYYYNQTMFVYLSIVKIV